MTDIEILTAVIMKAVNHGWQTQFREDKWAIHSSRMPGRLDFCVPKVDQHTLHIDMCAIIYDHDFAKSLWPPDDQTLEGYTSPDNPLWQHHLKEMVICDNPCKYLKEHAL